MILSVTYSQIWVEDYSHDFHSNDEGWNDDEYNVMLCVREECIVIGTMRSIQVPFYIELLSDRPELDLAEWDHVNECSLKVASGVLISGDFDTDGGKVDLNNGIYGVLVCYKGFNTITPDGIYGDDSYHVFMWPVEEHLPMQVLKRWVSPELN